MVPCFDLETDVKGGSPWQRASFPSNQRWDSNSHFCGGGLDLAVSHQSPVGAAVGSEHGLLGLLVQLHLEGLHVRFHVLIG